MAIGEKVLNFLTGGFAEKGLELGAKFVRDKDEAARFEHEWRTLCQKEGHELARITLEAEAERERMFNERTVAMEGTANDLKALPVVGSVVIFLRGAFRPLFAYFTAYLDWKYFAAGMDWTERQETLLLAVNLLVLFFFFGERAMKNVMPLIVQVFAARAGPTSNEQ